MSKVETSTSNGASQHYFGTKTTCTLQDREIGQAGQDHILPNSPRTFPLLMRSISIQATTMLSICCTLEHLIALTTGCSE